MKNSDRAAFPTQSGMTKDGIELHLLRSDGLTKREYFAAKAMEGVISNPDTLREITRAVGKHSEGDEFFETVKAIAYKYADAMLEDE